MITSQNKNNIQSTLIKWLLFAAPIIPLLIWNFTTGNNNLNSSAQVVFWLEITVATLILLLNTSGTYTASQSTLILTLAFICSGFVSALISITASTSIQHQLNITTHIIFCFILLHTTQTEKKYFAYGLLTAFFITFFFVYIFQLAATDPYYKFSTDIPFFSNIRHWGYLQAITLPFAYYLILQKRYAYIGYALATTLWWSIFWSGGRSVFMASSFITLLVYAHLFKEKTTEKLLLILMISISLSWTSNVSNRETPISRMFGNGENIVNQSLNRYSAGRIDMYRDTIFRAWDKNPLFGLGPDSFRFQIPEIFWTMHPHNSLIEAFFSYGLIGATLLILLSLRISSKANTKSNNLLITATYSCSSILLISMLDGPLYHAFSLLCFSGILAISLHKNANLSNKNSLKINKYTLLGVLTLTSLLHHKIM